MTEPELIDRMPLLTNSATELNGGISCSQAFLLQLSDFLKVDVKSSGEVRGA